MKLLSELITSFIHGWIPTIDPERVVVGIETRNGLKLLSQPSKAKTLSCPNCGSKRGWWNPPWNAWSCAEEVCIQAHAGLREPDWLRAVETYVERQKVIRPMEYFGVPDLFHKANFQDCQLPPVQIKELREWVVKPKGMLILAGNAGRGKTYAVSALIDDYRADERASARFINVSELYLLWKDAATSSGEDLALAKMYISPELIVLDDLGMRTPTDAFLDFLYVILNARVNSNAGTVITTNLNGAQMTEKLGEALTSRICSGKIIKVEGKDRRVSF